MGILDGRVALVTGGSKGLGAATARLFAEAGARVVVTFGNDAEAADRLIASLPGDGHRASHTPPQDTREIESLAAAIGAAEGPARHPGQQCRQHPSDPACRSARPRRRVFRLRAGGQSARTLAMVRACCPLLEASGHGLVANVGSIAPSSPHARQLQRPPLDSRGGISARFCVKHYLPQKRWLRSEDDRSVDPDAADLINCDSNLRPESGEY
jgi:hypothetical protein